jgi:predicted RNA-binding protein with PUA domain
VIRTATIVFDVTDAATGEQHTIYRCDGCKALVLSEDARDHLSWHDKVLLVPPAPSRDDR